MYEKLKPFIQQRVRHVNIFVISGFCSQLRFTLVMFDTNLVPQNGTGSWPVLQNGTSTKLFKESVPVLFLSTTGTNHQVCHGTIFLCTENTGIDVGTTLAYTTIC